jgi:hypothetical protein
MKVWLDDSRPMPAGYDRHVKTAEDAIELLNTGLVDEISLDNDLGFNKTEGQIVARYIENHAYYGLLRGLRVRVHTDDLAARKEICGALQRAKRYWMHYEQEACPEED